MVYFKNTSSAALVFHKKDKHLQIAAYFYFSEKHTYFYSYKLFNIYISYRCFTYIIASENKSYRFAAREGLKHNEKETQTWIPKNANNGVINGYWQSKRRISTYEPFFDSCSEWDSG